MAVAKKGKQPGKKKERKRRVKPPPPREVPIEDRVGSTTAVLEEIRRKKVLGKAHWWKRETVSYGFDNPKVQLRLEKLMGSHHVKITDRQFMRKLQDRIDEDHLENLFKRIRERETDEMLREKKLILDGRLSMDDIPKEMAEHPIFRISTVTDKLFGAPKKRRITHTTLARSGFKEQKSMQVVMKEKLIETTDVRETEEGMREKVVKVIEKGKVLNISAMPDEKEEEKPPEEEPPKVTIVEEQKPMSTEDAERLREVITEEEEVDKKYMYTPEQFAKIKYETALVKELKTTTGVEDLYSLAETIVRPMRVQTTSKKKEWD